MILETDYTELAVECDETFAEILMAELSMLGFDTFYEQDKGFNAYATVGSFDMDEVLALKERYDAQTAIHFSFQDLARVNWNEAWENSYTPIIIEGKTIIRASFHQPVSEHEYEYEIVVNPKMSFGTGHHETTQLMIAAQMKLDHAGKKVLDVGCGTGVLAIMAGKKNAAYIEACDIDPWSVENSIENVALNKVEAKIHLGSLEDLEVNSPFDILLANINRNILLEQLPLYKAALKANGMLLISGFYQTDVPTIQRKAESLHFKVLAESHENGWAMLKMQLN